MKFTILPLLLIAVPVLAQDISNQPSNGQPSNQAAVTSVGTIDQPSSARGESNPSQPTSPTQPSAMLTASPPSQAIPPLSPTQPSAPTAPLPILLAQQVSQPTPASAPLEPQQPTPSANPPAPIVLNSSDLANMNLQPNANPVASRTIESMQNLSNTLNNLIKVKSN
jgi:hypothetical protein